MATEATILLSTSIRLKRLLPIKEKITCVDRDDSLKYVSFFINELRFPQESVKCYQPWKRELHYIFFIFLCICMKPNYSFLHSFRLNCKRLNHIRIRGEEVLPGIVDIGFSSKFSSYSC